MVQLCLHTANLLYLASFIARDMLWLRILTCAGLLFGIVFFSCQPMPLYGPAAWHVVFLAINVVQIRQLVCERRQLALPAEQERLARAAFQDLSRNELLALLSRAMCESPDLLDPISAGGRPLTDEERALRDIAFCRLSRAELLNLLTRRLWRALKRLNPARWGRGTRPAPFPAAHGLRDRRGVMPPVR